MLRNLASLALLSLLPTCLGCAMCCGTDDYNYAAYDGRWQRHDMSHGRVGSRFAEAGFDALGAAEVVDGIPEDAEPAPGDDQITTGESSRTTLASFIE